MRGSWLGSSHAQITIYSTCPQSKDLPRIEYAARVADVARWSDEAGCRGMLVYTDNSIVDPWVVAQHVIASTSSLRPLVAIQPAYMHPLHRSEDRLEHRPSPRPCDRRQPRRRRLPERPSGTRRRDTARRAVRAGDRVRDDPPRPARRGCRQLRRALLPGHEPAAEADPAAGVAPRPAHLRVVASGP